MCHTYSLSFFSIRDLTPPNVFLDGEENVKLGDFGLATSKKARSKVVADIRHNKVEVEAESLTICACTGAP